MTSTAQDLETIKSIETLFPQQAENPFVKRTVVTLFNRLSVDAKVDLLKERRPGVYQLCSEPSDKPEQVWSNFRALITLSGDFKITNVEAEQDEEEDIPGLHIDMLQTTEHATPNTDKFPVVALLFNR